MTTMTHTTKTSLTTNRQYRADGTKQVIEIEYVPFTGDDWSDDAFDRVIVAMNDLARGIEENVIVLRCDCTEDRIKQAVLASYDACRYTFGEIGAIVA
jgi:hypothetical protein